MKVFEKLAEKPGISDTVRMERLGLIFFVSISSLCFLGAFAALRIIFTDPHLDLKQIEEHFGVSIPTDASDVVYSAGTAQLFWIKLNFKASPQSATVFADHFCDGGPYQGYDPFNAIDGGPPAADKVLIKDWTPYYSFSANTLPTYFGCRGRDRIGFEVQILIDETDPNLYALQLDLPGGCDMGENPIPCFSPYSDPLTYPLDYFPVGLSGVRWSAASGYVVVMKDICLETWKGMSLYSGVEEATRYLLEADIGIDIDGKIMPTAHISENRALIPKYDKDGNFNQWHKGLFAYCLKADWGDGMHKMTLHVTTKTGNKSVYSWSFRIGEAKDF